MLGTAGRRLLSAAIGPDCTGERKLRMTAQPSPRLDRGHGQRDFSNGDTVALTRCTCSKRTRRYPHIFRPLNQAARLKHRSVPLRTIAPHGGMAAVLGVAARRRTCCRHSLNPTAQRPDQPDDQDGTGPPAGRLTCSRARLLGRARRFLALRLFGPTPACDSEANSTTSERGRPQREIPNHGEEELAGE